MAAEKRRVTDKIVKWLRENGVVVFKYHGSVYGVVGHSDLYGILLDGRAFFIECKDKDGVVSSTQYNFLSQVAANNAIAFIARSLDDVKIVIEPLLAVDKSPKDV